MGQTPLSDELAQQALDAVTMHGSEAKAAFSLKLPPKTLHSRIVIAQMRKMKPSPGIHDPNNPAHLRNLIKRLEVQLADEQKQTLDHTLIKSRIIGLAHSVTD